MAAELNVDAEQGIVLQAAEAPMESLRRPTLLPGWPDHRLIWVFVVSYLFTGTTWGVETVLFPTYALSLGATTEQMGLIQAGLGVGLVVMAVPAGLLVDRYGSRLLYAVCGFIMPAIYVAMAQLRTPSALIWAATTVSAVATLNMVATNAAFYRHLDGMGKEKTGWYKGSLAVGLSLTGPVGGGVLINVIGYTPTFYALTLTWIIPAALALIALKSRPRPPVVSAPIIHALIEKGRRVAASKALLSASLIEGVGVAALMVFTSFIAELTIRHLGGTPQDVGIVLGLEGLGYAGLLFLGGPLVALLSRKVLLLSGFALSGLGYTLFGLAKVSVPVFAGSLLLGLGLGMLGISCIATLADVEIDKGSVAGAHGLSMGLFSAAGPLAAGYLGKAWGLGAMFWSVAALFGGLVGLTTAGRIAGRPVAETAPEVV